MATFYHVGQNDLGELFTFGFSKSSHPSSIGLISKETIDQINGDGSVLDLSVVPDPEDATKSINEFSVNLLRLTAKNDQLASDEAAELQDRTDRAALRKEIAIGRDTFATLTNAQKHDLFLKFLLFENLGV